MDFQKISNNSNSKKQYKPKELIGKFFWTPGEQGLYLILGFSNDIDIDDFEIQFYYNKKPHKTHFIAIHCWQNGFPRPTKDTFKLHIKTTLDYLLSKTWSIAFED